MHWVVVRFSVKDNFDDVRLSVLTSNSKAVVKFSSIVGSTYCSFQRR